MPWCPKCKMEYQPGITMCPDCKVELVEKLGDAAALVPFFQSDEKKVAEKLMKFFQYSDLDTSMKYDADNDLYIVSVDPRKQMEAKKLYQAFYFVELERMEKGESDIFTGGPRKAGQDEDNSDADTDSEDTDEAEASADTQKDVGDAYDTQDPDMDAEGEAGEEAEENPEASEDTDPDNPEITDNDTPEDENDAYDDDDTEDSSPYVMKADQYKDLSGTVWIFLIFGIAGLAFVLLNVIGILSVFSGWLPNIIMSALFLFFIYIALSTNQKAKKIQAEIDTENKLTDEINEWLKINVTEDFLNTISDENVSRELNYLKQIDTIKEMLISEFGNQNLAYLDRLIEEFYSRTFDNTAE